MDAKDWSVIKNRIATESIACQFIYSQICQHIQIERSVSQYYLADKCYFDNPKHDSTLVEISLKQQIEPRDHEQLNVKNSEQSISLTMSPIFYWELLWEEQDTD